MFKVTVTVESAPAAGSAAAAADEWQWPRCCIICGSYLGRHNVFPTCGLCYDAAMDAKQKTADDSKDKKHSEDKNDKDKTAMNADAAATVQSADR